MFERLKKLYDEGRIGMQELTNAVAKGWITQEQLVVIVGENENSI